ncbi:peroxidase-like [Helicoverpa zea]|uniref:peroxidase-like n=1 Tax=Helicoverpa zea TaxID=7113 RepID=UPI001F58CB91|nr:peroxidase-like [Helicoverpa zea]
MLILIYLVSVSCSVRAAIFYDSYYGTQITREDVKRHDKANTTFWCVNEIEPCDPHEGRRVDGSCNNLQHPTRGATHTPFARVLPPVFDKNFEPKKAASGNDLPLARYLRTRLVSVGRVPSPLFTNLAIHFIVFMSADIVSLHDTVNYIAWKPYCCLERGKTDYMCAPNKIPDDDPVHRFSGVRCVNMTRPETFQTIGCIKNDTAPERIVSSTPLLDLSVIYGNALSSLMQKGRSFQGGMVKTELDDKGRVWPPSTKTQANVCFLNQRPQETRCHDMPEDGGNTLAGINLMVVWFWRYHNFIAKQLAAVNPCWDDDKLFNVTRDINIAVSLQIYYYELLPIFMGYENMVKDGVLTSTGGFKDDYNPHVLPQVSLEYPFVLRWVHTVQEGPLKLYDKDGYYLKQIPIVNLTLRTGYFGVDDNMDYLTQGSFRQGSAQFDYIADPDVTEMGLGPHQYVSDLMTNDLAKNRYFGFPPYVKYREFCFGKPVHSFDDLHGIIDPERIEILKEVYEKVEDIDLLAGIWVEKPIPGGFVPSTFYCLVVEQLRRNTISDRHWYERPDRPNAFNIAQLSEIRKVTIARLLCDVGDTVDRIQPQAFLKAGYANQMCSCDEINKIDFHAWKDGKCEPENHWTKYLVY